MYNMMSKVATKWQWILVIGVALLIFGYPMYDRRQARQLRCEQFRLTNSTKRPTKSSKYSKPQIEGFQRVRSGSNAYKVHEDLENPQIAADTMDKINTAAHKLIGHMMQKYVNNPLGESMVKKEYQKIVYNGIRAMKKNFKAANLEENIPNRSGGDTSYVIDKGNVFAMCLRDPNNGYSISGDMNNLTFVLVHELTHLFTSTFGHDVLFWDNFKFVLEEAVLIGLYKPVDYRKTGSPYCGIVITYSPLFDNTLNSYRLKTVRGAGEVASVIAPAPAVMSGASTPDLSGSRYRSRFDQRVENPRRLSQQVVTRHAALPILSGA